MAENDEIPWATFRPKQETTFFRRPRTSKRIIVIPGPANIKVTPDAAALLLQVYFREVSKRHVSSSPIANERRPRKALRRVLERPVVDDGNLTEECPRVQERIRRRPDVSTVREAEGSVSVARETAAWSEHKRISTADLRRLVVERLPPSSVLREVLMTERENLSVDEFLSKLPIWLTIFKRDTGG